MKKKGLEQVRDPLVMTIRGSGEVERSGSQVCMCTLPMYIPSHIFFISVDTTTEEDEENSFFACFEPIFVR